MRITQRMSINRALTNLNRVQEQLATLQQRMATGKRVSKPSDDPAGLTRSLSVRSEISLNRQYQRNIESGLARLNVTEAALGSFTGLLQRARELAVLGGNSFLGQTQKDAIADEINQLLEEAIAVGNTKIGDQYVFGGFQSTTAAFTPVGAPPTAVTYNGDAGIVQRDVSIGVRVNINVPGDVALSSTFNALIAVRDDLLAGNVGAVGGADLAAIDAAMDDILGVRGQLGATTNRLEITRGRLDSASIGQQERLSQLEDSDLVATIVEMNAQQMTYEAALATTARTVQITLMDFLR